MPNIKTLTESDRHFFELVAQAIFANPFSNEREQLNQDILKLEPSISKKKNIEQVMSAVSLRLDKLKKTSTTNIDNYNSTDRQLLESAILFDIFHEYCQNFDDHILSQIASPTSTLPLSFAEDMINKMTKHGISNNNALHYFALAFQIRRAFFFINSSLLGTSESMRQLRNQLWNNIFTCDMQRYMNSMWNRMEDFSTLLLGGTGTGKGTAAAAIGRSGYIPFDQKTKCFADIFTTSFVSLNLSQFPESLIESEIFGHRKGAFTGAIDNHKGIFSKCSRHGAIFLDEIGDVSIPVQIKLLQVLQERTFSPVGSHGKETFNGRVIAATNKPLDDLRKKGLFRDDFYYRLCSDQIIVPSLYQRILEDESELEMLLSHILDKLCGDNSKELLSQILKTIHTDIGKEYTWPGNVRELEQATRRILLKGHYEGDFIIKSNNETDRLITNMQDGTLDATELLTGYCKILYSRYPVYGEVARRTGLDWRTVKKHLGTSTP